MVAQSETKPNSLELAKQGNPQVIAALFNRQLEPKGVSVKATFKAGCLQLILESSQVPPQQVLVQWIKNALLKFGETEIKTVKVYGREANEEFPDWQEDFTIANSTTPKSLPQELIEEKASEALVQAKSNQLAENSNKKSSFFGSVLNSVGGAVVGAAGTVSNVATQAGQNVASAAIGAGGALSNATSKAADGMVYMLDVVSENQMVQSLTKTLQIEWLLEPINKIDIVKAEIDVQQIKAKFPNEKPNEISHRIMLKKAFYVGGSGIATSIVPGTAVALIAIDIAATTALQAEMVYQIACAYGFDLKESARKEEALAILGLAVGGGQALKAGGKYAVEAGKKYAVKAGEKYAIKAGLGFFRNIPLAGAVIGASTNAAMLYAVGYAACRFYEAKLNPATIEVTLEAAQTESEHYLEAAITQEVIMDQILLHVVLAGNPGKTLKEMLPELKAANLCPASLELLEKNTNSLTPLEKLLNQISSDFAVPLLAQCQQIANLDGVITPEEAKVIQTITQKLNIDLLEIAQ
ncbi:EcsC family protein [Limnoraphis robusta]|uniref:EcsC family protein n=1 Tax=Limnoraphis robusta CS-951 TaxID=1637645 RepID=A0A0F5YK30_9CYAN|nr:EcsC family protein [Limnoraphis robusta]KKD39027.1 hypothetical protein WN50_05625 [Limnoraphis robusta CS-951]